MAPGLSNGHVTGDVCKLKVVAQIYFDASIYRLPPCSLNSILLYYVAEFSQSFTIIKIISCEFLLKFSDYTGRMAKTTSTTTTTTTTPATTTSSFQ